ncbi:MAG: hypothetical protein RLY86_3994, partial [Pseudomonadota bacterium]
MTGAFAAFAPGPVGAGGGSVGGGAGTSLAQWRLLKRTADTQMRLLADQPPVQRDVAYFRARIGT